MSDAADDRAHEPVGPVARPPVPRLPLTLVAGVHSGRNAAYVVAGADASSALGRTLWLTGPLQRALAASALRATSASTAGRLEPAGLPGGCPCCARGAVLGAGLARLLRQRIDAGAAIDSVVMQLEPGGDPAILADRLREPPCDRLVAITAIVAVLSAEELAALVGRGPGTGGRGGPRLRCVGAAGWVVVAPQTTAGASASDAPPAALNSAPAALSTVIGADWSGTLLRLDPGEAGGIIVPPGWTGFAHHPFDAASGPWQVVGRWPAELRFDRTAVADWLARLECEPDVAEVAFVGRTERQWLGWRPGRNEAPVTWRADSQLAIRPSNPVATGQAVGDGCKRLENGRCHRALVAAAPLLASGGG